MFRRRLDGWSDFFPRYTVLPWLKGREHRRLQTMREYLRVAFNRVPIGRSRKHPLTQKVHNLIAAPARFRLDHDCYAVPVELWAKAAAAKLLAASEIQGGRSSAFGGGCRVLILLTHANHLFSDAKQSAKRQPYPPLQTLIAAAVLRYAGHQVEFLDLTFERDFSYAIRSCRPTWSPSARTISIS